MDDVTAALRRAREEAEQREELALCQRLSHDREGLLAFFEEAGNIVGQLSRRDAALASLRRGLHTLKGSAGMLAFTQLAERCHLAEDAIEAGAAPGAAVVGVIERFQALRQMLSSIAGDHAGERVEVSREVLNSLAARLHQGLPATEAALELERLQLEPLSRPLRRMAEHARALAARLGKASLAIEVSDDGSFGDARATASLWAALLHLVRNAVDHGIERAPERVAAGKAECARLALSARREEAFTRIEIRDDGRGVDWGRVRTLAMSRGLPARTREDLARALFESSFSTRDEVSETSGRGIGLGAVRAVVEALGGRISIESEPGQGCCFVVQVPNQALRPRPGVLAARA